MGDLIIGYKANWVEILFPSRFSETKKSFDEVLTTFPSDWKTKVKNRPKSLLAFGQKVLCKTGIIGKVSTGYEKCVFKLKLTVERVGICNFFISNIRDLGK